MIISGINFSAGFNMRGALRIANAPTAVTAYIVSNTVANVSFTAPEFTGDTPITNYTAIAFPGGVRSVLSTSGSGVITVTGLTDNTNYTFSVTANNTDGPSANSVSTNSIITNSYPSAPTISYAELVSVSSANIVYTAPTSNGNSTITTYTAVSNVGGLTATVASGNITISGIVPNISYGFTVYAINQYGRGLSSNISNGVFTTGLSSSPTISYAKAEGPTSANIVYISPTSSGNSVIQYYTATSTPGNIKATVNTANSGNITIGGLTRGTNYTFTVTAKNSAGNSLPSASSSAITTYNVPNPPRITSWERSPPVRANIGYAAPSFDGGSPITSYTLTSVPENITSTVYSTASTGNISMIGLDQSRDYTFAVYATNDVGSSALSSFTPILPQGKQTEFTTPGTYTWIAPLGVTSVSAVCVGGGATAGQTYYVGGGGGGLGYKNNIAVVPGQSYTVVVGAPGTRNNATEAEGHGGNSWFISSVTVFGGGGYCSFTGPTYPGGTTPSIGGAGGSFIGDGGGNGGPGGGSGFQFADLYTGGGGGAGGYSGRGGYGQQGYLINVSSTNQGAAVSSGGGGGGGAGGANDPNGNGNWGGSGGGGGGVGLQGKGSDGFGGISPSSGQGAGGGGATGGSGGTNGGDGMGHYSGSTADGGNGGLYGGGATSGGGGGTPNGGIAGKGAVRIIWPGTTRQFPSTNTIDM